MASSFDTKITLVNKSRINEIDFNNLPFGKHFTDHMLVADYEDGEWKHVEILPYQPLTFDPTIVALHYGQSIFEGIKAYKRDDGSAYIFRPQDNFKRFNTSAERMCMPSVPEEIFIGGMKKLIEIDKDWIPTVKDSSLYIRPFMFATDTIIGVKPSEKYKFLILLSPSGAYYSEPMKILVEEEYTRAAPGGVGFAKNAGNYAASLIAAKKAKEKGCDQVLWTDACEHKWLQEVGTMNVMFIVDNVAITPSLDEGTILNGVTRNSVITVLKEMNIKVEERRINVDELIESYKQGKFQEAFGTGTAATISPISELKYRDFSMGFDVNSFKIAAEINKRLIEIRNGSAPDNHGWLVKI